MTPGRAEVAVTLENLCRLGQPLHYRGPHSTAAVYRRDPGRDEILLDIQEEYLSRQSEVTCDRRAAVIMSGPPGAGKSTLRAATAPDGEPFADDGHRMIDSDEIKDLLLVRASNDGLLDAFHSIRLPDGGPISLREMSGLVHEESVRIADDVRMVAQSRGEDIVIDGTLGYGPYARRLLDDLVDSSYRRLSILGVEVTADRAYAHAIDRWWNGRRAGEWMGGRFVPRSAIDLHYPTSEAHSSCWRNAQEMFDRAEADGGFEELQLRQVDDEGAVHARAASH